MPKHFITDESRDKNYVYSECDGCGEYIGDGEEITTKDGSTYHRECFDPIGWKLRGTLQGDRGRE